MIVAGFVAMAPADGLDTAGCVFDTRMGAMAWMSTEFMFRTTRTPVGIRVTTSLIESTRVTVTVDVALTAPRTSMARSATVLTPSCS